MAKVTIETYGCTLNQADSMIMGNILKQKGLEVKYGRINADKTSNDEYFIVNTCTVKNPTEQKILYRLGKLKGLGNHLIVTGCLASASPEKVLKAAPLANIVSTSNVHKIAEVIESAKPGSNIMLNKYSKIDKLAFGIDNNTIIARIPISEGCLSNCTFCETKFARGPLNSFSEELILQAVKDAVKNGAKEIELTSQDVGAYGIDKRTNIAELLKKVIEIEGVFKVRVGMLNPEHLHRYFDELLDVYANEKIYKFFHLPVQSGSSKVLKEMHRNYTVEDFKDYVNRIREKTGASIATDIIVGYPTETDADFEKSVELVREIKPEVVNVSKFGARPHAPASSLVQLSEKVVKERSIVLSRAVREIEFEQKKKHIGMQTNVLITEKTDKSFAGRDMFYNEVAVLSDGIKLGDFVNIKITSNSSACLIGIISD